METIVDPPTYLFSYESPHMFHFFLLTARLFIFQPLPHFLLSPPLIIFLIPQPSQDLKWNNFYDISQRQDRENILSDKEAVRTLWQQLHGFANTYTLLQKPYGQKEVDTLSGIYSNKEMKVISSYIMYVMNKMELFHNTIYIRCLFRQPPLPCPKHNYI